MYVYILWLFIFLLTFILYKLINIEKKFIICIFISIFIFLFTSNINLCINAALKGSELWYKSILPTTFPFVVICNLLIYYDGINLYSKFLGPLICRPLGLSSACSFPIAASILCGYPLGAKYCSDIYNLKYINKNEYLRLLNIASNAGPIFLLGSVGATMLHNTLYGYILLASNYVSVIFIGLLTKKNRTTKNNSSTLNIQSKDFNIGTAIKNSIENGVSAILSIGGFIIIFSIVIALVKESSLIHILINKLECLFSLPLNSLYPLFLGCIEITNGCSLISNSSFPVNLKLSAISFLCSFSGIAIIAQVSSFINKNKINYKTYVFLKFVQGIFSGIFTFILLTLLPIATTSLNRTSYVQVNMNIYFIPLLVLIVIYIVLFALNKLFFHSS